MFKDYNKNISAVRYYKLNQDKLFIIFLLLCSNLYFVFNPQKQIKYIQVVKVIQTNHIEDVSLPKLPTTKVLL